MDEKKHQQNDSEKNIQKVSLEDIEKAKEDDISFDELKKQLKDLEDELAEKKQELENLKKNVDDWKAKANSYLGTASYYKSQAEDNKKDFDRYKERNKNIEADALKNANELVAKKLIPILDNFNHAMKAIDSETMKGFIMIYSALIETLKDLGVAEIICKNEKLDPLKHNCIEAVKTDDEKLDGMICKVYLKGYYFEKSNQVIRPANVAVYKF